MPTSIFVSYSHQDAGLVKPVVGLLRATEEIVFQDLDSIKPGRRWRREIEEALYAAQLIILFWCYHSALSTEVRKEYELALTIEKNVLPVLLDATPLPEQLHEFQWVDLRQLVTLAHRSSKRRVIQTVMIALMVGFTLLSTAEWSLPLLESPESLSPALEQQQRDRRRQLDRLLQSLVEEPPLPPLEQQLLERLQRLRQEREQQLLLEWQLEQLLQELLRERQLRLARERKQLAWERKQLARELEWQSPFKLPQLKQRERELEQRERELEQRERELEPMLLFQQEGRQLPPLSKPWPGGMASTLVFLLALLTLSVWALATRKARHRRTRTTPTDYQQQMAEKLQAELSSRGIGSA